MGRGFFWLTREHLDRTPEIDHAPAWTFAQYCLPQAPVIALDYLERYAALFHYLGLTSMVKVETILRDGLALVPADTRTFLRLVGSTLAFIPGTEQLQVLTWCQEIAAVSVSGVLDFVRHLTDLQQRLPGQRLQPGSLLASTWHGAMQRQDTPILLWNRPRRRIASRNSRVVSPSRTWNLFSACIRRPC